MKSFLLLTTGGGREFQCRGRCYLPRQKAEADNTVTRFDTS